MSSECPIPPDNGVVLDIVQIVRAVMTSVAEAEIGAPYVNAQKKVPERKTIEEMVHPQPHTPMQTDNITDLEVKNINVQPRRSNAMDMIFHRL